MYKQKKPLFSIVTCTYNSEQFIDRNVTSVKDQTFKNIEHIFVDGNSEDKTLNILYKYERDSSYKVNIIKVPPKGISNALNNGIRKSNGKFLFFLNADDNFHDSRVLNDVSLFLRNYPKLDWIYSKIMVKDGKGNKIGTFPNNWLLQRASPYLLKFINFIPHQASFVKKEVFEKYGNFDEYLKASMDTDFWLRISKKTNWRFVNRIIADYTVRKGARSSDKKYREDNVKLLYRVKRKHLNSLEFYIFKQIHTHFLSKRTKKFLQ